MLSFAILGPFHIRSGDNVFVPRGPKVTRLFALLLLRANEVVSIDTLADELWDDDSRPTAQSIVRTHVYHVRQMLSSRPLKSVAERLSTEPGGYRFRIEDGELDAHKFTYLANYGRTLLQGGDAEGAAQVLRSALALWQGPVLEGVSTGRLLSQHLIMLSELRIQAVELRIEADLLLGRYREVLPDLRSLVIANPLNEWLQYQLMDALFRAGRRDESLATFRHARSVLSNELGVEPSVELQRLHRRILDAGMPPRPRTLFMRSKGNHWGGLPCLREGRSACLVRSIAIALISTQRVSAGSMTSSTRPRSAA
jgi:SARP family transcriptional regulator, regulator of embCAB operon